MNETSLAQLVGAIMGSIIAVTILGIIRLVNSNKDIDY